jgi:hypothetical protein
MGMEEKATVKEKMTMTREDYQRIADMSDGDLDALCLRWRREQMRLYEKHCAQTRVSPSEEGLTEWRTKACEADPAIAYAFEQSVCRWAQTAASGAKIVDGKFVYCGTTKDMLDYLFGKKEIN